MPAAAGLANVTLSYGAGPADPQHPIKISFGWSSHYSGSERGNTVLLLMTMTFIMTIRAAARWIRWDDRGGVDLKGVVSDSTPVQA